MQQVSLLMEVAGLKEEWVEVKRHTVEVLFSTLATLDEALSSEESQRLHGSCPPFVYAQVLSFLVAGRSCHKQPSVFQ